MDEAEFAAAGLLDGLEGAERDARLTLLRRLHEDGCAVEEMRAAVKSGRLPLLPVERLLARRRRHTLRDGMKSAGVSEDFAQRNHRALGLPLPDPDAAIYDDDHLENLKVLRGMVEAGLPEEDLLLLGRILGQSTRRTAEAIVDVVARALSRPGDTPDDVALRLADFAEAVLPVLGLITGGVLRLHLLDVVQSEAVLNLEGEVSAADVTVASADLAGFTALSDELSIEELGRVAGRFEDLVIDVAEPPVRLVKVLGDGAMLVCADADPLVRSMLDLVDAAAAEGYLPPVHAGVAHGPALHSAGDWLGRTVNVAARLCAAAPPGAVLVTPQVRTAAANGIVWQDAGAYELRGISEPVRALRAGTRRA
jgi:adenylate cyclase